MAQGDEEKRAAEAAKEQAAAEKEIAELRKKLAAAEQREAQAGMRVAELEAEIERIAAGAPEPLAAGGTITVDAAGRVVS